MIINLINASRNVDVNAGMLLKKYLKPQNPDVLKKVDGKWVPFTPNRSYYAESPEEVTAYNMLRLGRDKELLARSPALYAKAMQLAAQGGPKLHEASPEFDNKDKRFRGPGNLTSSAIGRMSYNPNTSRITFAFRKKGGLGKTYSLFMDGKQVYKWISSSSIGRYFNRYLKNNMYGPSWSRK